ncbi:hypothetical protein L7F22_052669 [Adiantum nelumboides]|nr:hypothetical protein [Adiantum nelumboides]
MSGSVKSNQTGPTLAAQNTYGVVNDSTFPASTSKPAPSSSNTTTPTKKKRVLIIGAGCSGMAAGYAFSLSPEKFEVKIVDKAQNVGGSATSYQLPNEKNGHPNFGAEYINDGVQGASPVFHNTLTMFEKVLGFRASDVGMQISFGKGQETFWSNVFPSQLVDEFKEDIKKFGKVLPTIKTFEPFFALIPVDRMLKMFRFSPSFGERMVFPLVALFMGTGNQTKHVSSAIIERLFLDPNMRLFEFSQESLLASVPHMKAFPELGRVYGLWRTRLEAAGNIRFGLSCGVASLERGTKKAKQLGGNILATYEGHESEEPEVFDDVIFACDADSALKILQNGSGPSWKERKILGNVLYKWDITVTHHDYDYMKKHYEMNYNSDLNAKREDEESKKAFKFAEENWKPLYLIKMYEEDPSQIEMSFDLTHYQGQFEGMPAVGKDADITLKDAPPVQRQTGEGGKKLAKDENPKVLDEPDNAIQDENKQSPPKENHVYQTIYLDYEQRQRWTKEEVAKDKIILEKWWKQQSHRWQHYGGTVPWMWTINGQNHTSYAGAWSLVNMHEVGMVSGFSAAYNLGAQYPFKDNDDCAQLFRLYLLLGYMSRMRSEDRKGFFS